jgi:hypothetical protein
MALPTLDAVFASAADQPRRYMLSQWLVNELGSGSVADYPTLPERYLWAKIAVAAGAPKDEAFYINAPKQYAWKDIYNAVSGSSLGTIDWGEKQALGHIAAAYRGDTGNPANLATYIDWPWRYQVASIITQLSASPFPSDGLLAFWKLDDLTDASGNGNILTNNNSVTFASGKIGNAANLNNNYLSRSISVTTGNECTISLWAKAVSLGVSCILGRFDGLKIGTLEDGTIEVSDYNQAYLAANVAVSITDWRHIVLVTGGGSAYLWVDGSQKDSGPNILTDVPQIGIGNDVTTTSEPFFGLVDAVGIWGRALTSEEIAVLYNNGNGVEPA